MKSRIIFMGLFIVVNVCVCHGQWADQAPELTGAFTTVKFLNSTEGLIVGYDGVVLRTENQGETWISMPNELDVDFFDFQFINDTLIYAYAPGEIYMSTDFGVSWTEKSGLPDNAQMAYFLNADTGFTGNNIYGLNRTIDGGDNWSPIWDHPADNVTYCEVNAMDFLNDSNGVASGRGLVVGGGFSIVLKTQDGGQTWSEIFGSSSDDIRHPVDIQYVDDSLICAVDDDFDLLRSNDTGNTWSVEKFNDPDGGWPSAITATSLFAMNMDTVFVSGETTMWIVKGTDCFSKRKIIQTTDGGKHWINQFFEEGEFPDCGMSPLLGNITFLNDSTGICPGYDIILRTTNGGGDTHMPDTVIHGNIEDLAWDESGILVYPNPASHYLTIELITGDFDKLEIYSLSGNFLKMMSLKRINEIDLTPFSSGAYIFKFSGEKTSYRRIQVVH